jgi:4-carboxymuconolactone decarboxylase
VDYTELLRCLAINDARFVDDDGAGDAEIRALDPKSLALVRLGGLVAVGGAVPSYGAQADAAVSAGASAPEIVDVLVAAAPKMALALGYDVEEGLMAHSED